MSPPTVSVIMSTYNHGDLVTQAIDSVLCQRDVDFEFLIADDGSTDDSRNVISRVHDSRLHFYPNEVNRGACAVLNELLVRASGEYVALINSDDYWTADDKLAHQVRFLREHANVGACFGRVRFVDRQGEPIDKSSLPHGRIFDEENRSQGDWLRHFFLAGNCLCHPTILIRRACYDRVGFYDNRLRQLPDFDMWIRIVKEYEIHIDDREFIAFRQLEGENASSSTPANLQRLLNETYFILKRFFDGVSREMFLAGFRDLLVAKDPSCAEMQIEQALLFLRKDLWSPRIYNLIGLEMIHGFLQDETQRALLAGSYGIDDLRFHSMAGDVSSFAPAALRGRVLLAELTRRAAWRASEAARSALAGVRHGR